MFDHGPSAVAAKLPCGELDVSVTVTGCVSARVTPASWSWTVTGPSAAPAPALAGGVENTSAGVDHVEKSRQLSLNDAPSSAAVQVPAHAAAELETESWIAVASRRTTRPL